MAKPKGIDWDVLALGVESDRSVADRLGVHPSSVRRQRVKRGISPGARAGGRFRVDWDQQPLGLFPDETVAANTGHCRGTVAKMRNARGIPEFGRVDWSKQPLGQETDASIAARLGVDPSAVCSQRRLRGIPAFDRGSVEWSTIDFTTKPLGDIARDLGVSTSTALSARKRLKKTGFKEEVTCTCGKVFLRKSRPRPGGKPGRSYCSKMCRHDTHKAVVAHGSADPHLVRYTRAKRAMWNEIWSRLPLGKISDGEIAKAIGCERQRVTDARNYRRIPRPKEIK